METCKDISQEQERVEQQWTSKETKDVKIKKKTSKENIIPSRGCGIKEKRLSVE